MATPADVSWNGSGDTDSDDDTQVFPAFVAEDVPASDFDFFNSPAGDVIDGEIVNDDPPADNVRSLKSGVATNLDRSPKSGMPNIDEWMHFFSKVVIRLSTDFYIDYAFRDIDEEQLTDREIQRIRLTDLERDRMARPFAEYSNKSKFMRKHGRMIIASADSIDAVLQMGMWFSRVNRIASKYRGTRTTRLARPAPVRAAPVFSPTPRDVPDMVDRSDEPDVSSGQSPPPARGDHWRPDIAGRVFNPTGGG